METTSLLYVFLSLSISIIVAVSFLSQARQSLRRLNLPPTPPALPFIGHLHLLKNPVHRALHRLSQNVASPVFSLRFGSRLVIVVSSASAVDECFTRNDIVLANRPHLLSGKHIGYDNNNVIGAPYGDHWRSLRRLMSLELFSTTRLNGFASVRREEVQTLLWSLRRIAPSQGFARVELQSKLSETNFNIMMRMVAGKRYYGEGLENSEEAKEFRELVKDILKYAAASNPADFVPILRWIDYNDYVKNLKEFHKKMDAFLQGLVDEHRTDKSKNSMIDHMLSLQETEPETYSDTIIKGLVLAIILAGTDTSAVTMEWVMSNLLNHPQVLKKARAELDAHVGHDRLVDETDLPQLKYLQAIISETLRLFPATPLLLPHMASDHCTIAGYNVPRDTIVMINAWAVHRDPEVWEEPETFKPERFEGGEVEGKNLIPFGLGRRACPGAGLAKRVMGVTLGSLIQCFEWERLSGDIVDLTEGEGLTMPKLEPLEALCKPREITNKLI